MTADRQGTPPRFRLRLEVEQIPYWAERYEETPDEAEIVSVVAPRAKVRGYLLADELAQLTRWKSPRTRSRVMSNDPELIEAVTRTALAASREEIRIGILQILNGIGWPTASVLLHFCAKDDYPILDFRALWSLSVDVPGKYTFEFWWAYVLHVRGLKATTGLTMRTIDRALWQYSREHQP